MTHCRSEALGLLSLLELFLSTYTRYFFSYFLCAISDVDSNGWATNIVLTFDFYCEKAILKQNQVVVIGLAWGCLSIGLLSWTGPNYPFIELKFIDELAREIIRFMVLDYIFEGLIVIKCLDLLDCFWCVHEVCFFE